MGFRLVYNGVEYAPESITTTLLEDMSPNQHAAIEFCQLWLSDVEPITLHTSGSTGAPKPIDLTRSQMIASARATLDALRLGADDRALLCLNARFVAGCMMLVRALVGGLCIEVVEPSANPLSDAVVPFDFTALVPLQLEAILDAGGASLDLLNRASAVLIGGAPLSIRLEERAQQVIAPLYHTYGMTETVSHIALRRINGSTRSEFFTPQSGVELGLDERDALRIRAPMSDNQWVQTNDRVELNADGAFRWLGRLDNVINSGGVKVQVERVEAVLESLLAPFFPGGLPAYFVIGIEDERLGERVALLLESTPLSEQVEESLLTALRQELGAYETPRSLLYAPRFTLTPTGKIDRNATKLLAMPS